MTQLPAAANVAAATRQKLFGSKSEQEVRESYHSLVVLAPKYNQLRFRTKFNTRGYGLCYFWKYPERTRLSPKDDLKTVLLRPHLQLKSSPCSSSVPVQRQAAPRALQALAHQKY